MENAETYLRRIAPKSNEMAVNSFNATGTAAKFTSGLTLGFGRTGTYVFNNSHANSGECYYGPAGVTPETGIPLFKNAVVEIPVTDDIDLYFVAETGANGDLRVLELA